MHRRAGFAARLACARALAAAGINGGASAARVLHLLGRSARLDAPVERGVLYAANRCGPFDALAVIAATGLEVRFAGEEALLATPDWLREAIGGLVVRSGDEIRAALSRGIVVQFPDSAAGADPLRCRYRLHPLASATRVAPLALHEIQNQTNLRAGPPLEVGGSPIDVRNRIRTALANLYA